MDNSAKFTPELAKFTPELAKFTPEPAEFTPEFAKFTPELAVPHPAHRVLKLVIHSSGYSISETALAYPKPPPSIASTPVCPQ